MPTIHYAFADDAGKIVKCGTTPDWASMRAKRETWPNHQLVIDRQPPRPINPNTDRVEGGKIVYGDPPREAVTEDDVRRFTSIMIRQRFERDDQVNAVIDALMTGNADDLVEIQEHIRAMRQAGKRLRAMDPIPPNFRDPQFWN